MSGRHALGVDVGGTFTDLVLIRLSDGAMTTHKVPSTPDDPSRAMGEGIAELLQLAGVAAGQVGWFGHGTTVATNAMIQGRTARTGLVTTEGFRDTLEIRRQRQPHNYNIRIPKPRPPVPRRLRFEVPERVFLMGRDPVAPRRADLDPAIAALREAAVESVAICFLHAYLDPSHEKQVAAWLAEALPGVFICPSHEILAEFREYERLSTTVLNAGLGPVMSRYLSRLQARCAELGLGCEPHILQSNGGVASPREAGEKPVRTLASGPAAGVTGAIHACVAAGFPDIITFDVGGTSLDVCLVEAGRPAIAREKEFGGWPVRFPMLDVHSVGAGGGSIAWVDAGGFLQVGPQSAGAHPGPACYGRGGTRPTVTDANVVLGRLHPERLLGGRMPIRRDLAEEAIRTHVAAPLGMGVEEAAAAILTILNETMLRAVRLISVEQGHDPRRFALASFGGGGPLLSQALAAELGIRTVVVPPGPGLLCALGLLVADIRTDFSRTCLMPLDGHAAGALAAAFGALDAEADRWLAAEAAVGVAARRIRALDMRYHGQSHELTVPVPDLPTEQLPAALAEAFAQEHARVYGYATGAAVQVVTARLSLAVGVARPPAAAAGTDARDPLIDHRQVWFAEAGGWTDCPVLDRARLAPGTTLAGPAILEQMDTTTVLHPGQSLRCDAAGNLIIALATADG
ncbi:hydantoinase/oxoprolinase family protein [Falsiroseomonas oryzae]|uniref:hydantoinase/oxoprolinase family protein n=1 Tax=Falsiroseomonas oryzae TaxID=2766473 RepID=UPI0022EAF467|nr:hydantoinase/oxoprolinase family protein [Roseomonas sp. MO-31]